MVRTTLLALSRAALFAVSIVAAAQPAGLPKGQPARPDSFVQVSLGQSAVPLHGPWKFTLGDSPIDPKTGKPLWAEPEFDDSKWETVDITPQEGSFNPYFGTPGYVPGWTAKGHAGYSGYAWYRMQVNLLVNPAEDLALAGPTDIDDVYQVFDSGKLAGTFGDFSGSSPKALNSQPMMFPLGRAEPIRRCAVLESSFCAATHTIAFRVWMSRLALMYGPTAGGLHTPPVLGNVPAIQDKFRLQWLDRLRNNVVWVVLGLMFAALAALSGGLMLFDRIDRAYFWMGMFCLLMSVANFNIAIDHCTQWFDYRLQELLNSAFIIPPLFLLWVMFLRAWFHLQRPTWLPWVTTLITSMLIACCAVGYESGTLLSPQRTISNVLMAALEVVLLLLIAAVLVQGTRKRGRGHWIVLPVLSLWVASVISQVGFEHARVTWFPFGISIELAQILCFLLAAAQCLLLVHRWVHSARAQRLVALEVKQAREVQQVILPEARTVFPGLIVESEYRPAREVGGDFFQIIPHKTDGSLLIVAGDVAGKGLQAGMLVALLVGAIRSTAEVNDDPSFVLRALNRRLMGRADAAATCLALRIEADGEATLANAGHPIPYLNGEMLAMEGALPMGIIESAEPSVMRFQFKERDRLMLMSDGIVEATDSNGQLYGFERLHDLLRTARSAPEVASAAQAFGQEDDISVISLTRTRVAEPAHIPAGRVEVVVTPG